MNLLYYAVYIIIILFSVIIHEVAHGWMAERFGDDTARSMGRLTLNPLPHIDLIGTLLLPAILIYSHAPIIGWAKPVPVNPYRLNTPKSDMMWVGIAGPASNVALALAAAGTMWFLRNYNILPPNFALTLNDLAYVLLQINVMLFVFNLIPVPPLDGSRVVTALLPSELAYRYAQLENYGIIIVFALFMTGVISRVLGPFINLIVFFMSGGRFLM